jgi:hypothetical protein
MTNQNIELDQYISKCQPNEYIMGASNEKAPGEPQIPAEALKWATPPPLDTKKMLLKLLQDCFYRQTDPKEASK